MQKLPLIFFFAIFSVAVTVFAVPSAPWSSSLSLPESYSRFRYSFTQPEIAGIRQQIDRMRPKNMPDSRMIRLDGGLSSGSGGGGGIACFATAEDQAAAFDNHGRLLPQAENLITQIYVNDYLNNGRPRTGFLTPLPGEDGYNYILRIVRQNIRPVHPTFASKLEDILAEIQPAKWLHRPSLPLFADTGMDLGTNSRGLCPYGRYVQMAVRYERAQNSSMPQVVIDVDPRLLDLLFRKLPEREATINEGLLILHEAVYLLSSLGGSWTSARTFQLNANLLQQNLYFDSNGRAKNPAVVRQELQPMLESALGFFELAFSGPLAVPQNGYPVNPFHVADYELKQLLQTIGTRNQIAAHVPLWTYYLEPSVQEQIATALMRSPPIFAFMYQLRYTGVTRAVFSLLSPEDIYLQPNRLAELRLLYCQSVEFDLDPAGADKANAAIIGRAVQFCRDQGVPALTPADRRKFLKTLYRL